MASHALHLHNGRRTQIDHTLLARAGIEGCAAAFIGLKGCRYNLGQQYTLQDAVRDRKQGKEMSEQQMMQ